MTWPAPSVRVSWQIATSFRLRRLVSMSRAPRSWATVAKPTMTSDLATVHHLRNSVELQERDREAAQANSTHQASAWRRFQVWADADNRPVHLLHQAGPRRDLPLPRRRRHAEGRRIHRRCPVAGPRGSSRTQAWPLGTAGISRDRPPPRRLVPGVHCQSRDGRLRPDRQTRGALADEARVFLICNSGWDCVQIWTQSPIPHRPGWSTQLEAEPQPDAQPRIMVPDMLCD